LGAKYPKPLGGSESGDSLCWNPNPERFLKMATVFAVFAIGLAVTLVVAKGMLQANEFAKRELKKLDDLDKSGDPN
jgi:hypothetical protein